MTTQSTAKKEGMGTAGAMPEFIDAGVDKHAAKAEAVTQAKVVQIDQNAAERQSKIDEILDAFDLSDPANIAKLVAALRKKGYLDFPVTRSVKISESEWADIPKSNDKNRKFLYDLIFSNGKRPCPMNDAFHARLVDQSYTPIDDEYDFGPWLDAFYEAGMKEESHEVIRKSMREWAKGQRRNSLSEHLMKRMPRWDGKKRAAKFFIKRFECANTKLNKMFSLAFMNQIYRRIVEPGCSASLVPVLVGIQNAGKSYFAIRLVKIIMAGYDPTGRKTCSAVEYDLDQDFSDLMRTVTGNSFLVMISEMTGFGTREMSHVKAMVSRESDPLDFKYEGNRLKPRQFVLMMDSNKYEGLQRDETGNRRFYPVFLGQGKNDAEGRQTWDPTFKLNMEGDAEEVWQIMAECHHYQTTFAAAQRERGRVCADDGYHKKLIRRVSDLVFAFNAQEVKNDRGTVQHRLTNQYFGHGLHAVKKVCIVSRMTSDGKLPDRISVVQTDLLHAIKDLSGGTAVADAIERKVTKMGGRSVSSAGEALKYQWDVKPHPDPKIAAEFTAKREAWRGKDNALAEVKKLRVEEFMTIHFGEDYEDELTLSRVAKGANRPF